jgi:hypothetical protein
VVLCESYPRGGSRQRRALDGCPRPPYIHWCALGYKSVSIYPSRLQYGRLIQTALNYLDCLVLYTKYLHVLGPTCQVGEGPLTGRGGSTDRSAGLLVGRARLSETAETLVGGDPRVPMSLKPRSTCRHSGRDEVMSKRSKGMAPLRSCRVHGDPKKKNPSNACTESNIELQECRSRRSK